MNAGKLLAITATASLLALAASAQELRTVPSPGVSASLEADRQTVFQFETVRLTLSIYSRGQPIGKTLNLLSMPEKGDLELKGFEELPLRRWRDGVTLHEMRRFRSEAIALSPGSLRLSPVLRVKFLMRGRPVDIPVKGTSLKVKPLPEAGRPANFSGAVGQFTFSADVTPVHVAAGDLIRASMTIAGDGYTDNVTGPVLSAGRHFKTYEPRLISKTRGRELVYEQVIVPQSTNAAVVPLVTFTFFEPSSASYKTLTEGPFPLTFRSRAPLPTIPETAQPSEAATTNQADAPTGPAEIEPGAVAAPPAGVTFPVAAALAAYWIFAAVLGLLALRSRKTAAPGMLAVFTLVAVLGFVPYGAAVAKALAPRSDAVLAGNETARLAPAHAALASFELTRGTAVRLLETRGDWAKIALRKNRGWIPSRALRPAGR